MQDKLVSIILPVYNGEKYLEESINSVLNQTYKNIELIIVNDNSSDSTLSIAEVFKQKDNRVKVITNKTNLKLPMSLNIGFANANGEYYTWTSDDNFYDLNAIEKMVSYLESHPNDAMVCADFIKLNEKTNKIEVLNLNVSPQNMINSNCVGACFLYRKSVANLVGEYNKNKFLVEDYDYWLRIMLKGDIGHISKTLYTYRIHNESLTGTRMNEILLKTKQIQAEYYPIYKKKFKNISLNKENKKVSFLEQIFSVKNNENKKIVRVLGVKVSFKRKNKKKNINYLKKYKLAKKWIEKYTVDNKGICVESNQPNTIYPECTGYYIPTLLKFGDKKRAIDFGNYLITIQNEDGSWNEPSGKTPYTFDTAQILKGLVALIENGLDEGDKYKKALIKGCDYILSMQREDGSIATSDYSWWGLPYGKQVPEAIHVYCLEPLRKTAQMFGIDKYENCVQKALNYYLSQEDLTDFKTLSHFNAYIIEGLIDMGETKRAKRAMDLISLHQRENGMVPAYSFVDFVCSTGLFQYAICWYKLGEIDKADKAFNYACSLQNKSGGFYGSYTKGLDKANYFPNGEIDWAVKYFLDAIYYGQKVKYENLNNIWISNIDTNDERYSVIESQISNENIQLILDLGCGKGRYTKNLITKFPNKKFHSVDITSKNFDNFEFKSENKVGTILNIPYSDNSFDCIFTCEVLEHCIDVDNAIKEMTRVLKPNGKLIIIDKNIKLLGKLELANFEQWFSEKDLCKKLKNNGYTVKVKSNLEYEDGRKDGLFSAWIGVKNEVIL